MDMTARKISEKKYHLGAFACLREHTYKTTQQSTQLVLTEEKTIAAGTSVFDKIVLFKVIDIYKLARQTTKPSCREFHEQNGN